ncbi:MAG: methyltransferase domain-containing protein [Beijerinckiaceae bacterium]|nr:methyltransferase domain-containing protein [Beijerinckiaceae bacterium]
MVWFERAAVRAFIFVLLAGAPFSGAMAQGAGEPFEPYSGQPGKDVVWVPTPQATVDVALNLAALTPRDYVIDLGSGDGRMVISAARRGARGHGVEFNPKMVEISQAYARDAGVADRAAFIEGDMYAADLSKASVLPLFLLPVNLDKLVPNFLKLRPGVRIVTVGYTITDWDHDEVATVAPPCNAWCSVYKYIVPADANGKWKLAGQDFIVAQKFQKFTGTLGGIPIEEGRLHGDEISFAAGGAYYYGTVTGNEMRGLRPNEWRASRTGD